MLLGSSIFDATYDRPYIDTRSFCNPASSPKEYGERLARKRRKKKKGRR